MKVIIIEGAMRGKIGLAEPSRAVGCMNNRIFTVIVRFDDGSGFYEIPIQYTRSIR